MQGMILNVSGRWAQFRKPETNNNPLTHDFITKTAFVGLMGAVLGKERQEMRVLFPNLCEDLLYGVQIKGVVKKESWGFTLRRVDNQNDPMEKSPRQMEFLRNPDFTIVLALQNERSAETFTQFARSLRDGEACYTPVLGLHNCPAELAWMSENRFESEEGEYTTKGFVLRSHRFRPDANLSAFRVGFERVPTYQDNDWWNRPDGYREVAYPSNGMDITVNGDHYRSDIGEAWCLI
jgi:CRISPR-associated protein Cas5h